MAEPIPANAPISAIIARHHTAAASAILTRPAIAIVPNYSSWNDFGRYFYSHLYIFLEGGSESEFDIRLMFQGAPRTDEYVPKLLGTRDWLNLSEINDLFCSILGDAESYRLIVGQLGFPRAVSALRQLGDAVVLQLEGNDTARLALISTLDFHLGALRQEKAYVAFRRGRRYLRPQSLPVASEVTMEFSVQTKLLSADNNYEISLNFQPDDLFRSRISILIGKNGSGKTQLLLGIIEGLRIHTEDTGSQPIRFAPRPNFNRLIVFSSVASDSYPRAIPPWQGIDYQYFSMIGGSTTEVDTLTGAIMDCFRDDGQIQFFQSQDFFPIKGEWHY
jgi:hypothetical protein